MIRGIVDSHEKTVKHLEFAYDDVVEDAKREELLAKIKSATPDLNLHPPSATISGKQIDSLPPNSLTKGKTLLLQQKRQSIRSNSSSIHLQASNIQVTKQTINLNASIHPYLDLSDSLTCLSRAATAKEATRGLR